MKRRSDEEEVDENDEKIDDVHLVLLLSNDHWQAEDKFQFPHDDRYTR